MAERAEEVKKNSKISKLIIILLFTVSFLLGTALILLQTKEKREIAEAAEKANAAKADMTATINKYNKHSYYKDYIPPSVKSAELSSSKAEKAFKNKNYKEAEVGFNIAEEHFKEAIAFLETYGPIKSKLSEISSDLPALLKLGENFPKLKKEASENINTERKKAEELIALGNLESAEKSIAKVQDAFSRYKSKFNAALEKMNRDWEQTLKDNAKESYQVFISTYPHSEHIKEAKKKIKDFIKKEEETIQLAEEAEKKKEEELKIEQEEIAARKAEIEKEMKIKRELEQVVTINFDDGSSYTGQLDSEKKPHGEGTFSYTNSNVYRGKWKNGLYHGEGEFSFYTGVTFKGEWLEGKRNGKGLLTWNNGDRFAGIWKEGVLNGKAIWAPKKSFKVQMNFYEGENIGKLDQNAFLRKKKLIQERYENKRMSSKEKRSYEFVKRYLEALKLLHEENKGITFPDLPPHIDKHDSYIAGRMTSRDAEKHEALLKSLFFEHKRYLMVTKKSLEQDEIGETSSAEFGGYTIMTANLGVILDNSGSMSSYLPRLRKKIEEKFKKSAFMEVTGCSLYPSGEKTELTQEDAAKNTIRAIRFLVDKKGADTIYWFSDLKDIQTPEALEELQDFFYKNMVTFYLSTVGNSPSKELRSIVEDSGGKILRY